ncbi:penicillin-binding protein 1A [Salisaeta longa]|uniref:penicillin-binding protein 1A n=1 Tax=Salisaeta longa TaxID=503170 RepID=UPI0003B782C7|nr:PBP1A family penicillin-binding protein [Salisaeta longa]
MSDWSYSEEELEQYFNDRTSRHERAPGDDASPASPTPNGSNGTPPNAPGGLRGFFYDRFASPEKAQAAFVLSLLAGSVLLVTLLLGGYMWSLTDDIPSTKRLENPTFQLATIAYTANGKQLARYASQNRSWAQYDSIAPEVINALVATEDHRFYQHWGVDIQGIMGAIFDILTGGDLRGASTITQQLARNLYNKVVGREVTITRKLKEMVTAVELERRYTKREIIEMYLNTVSFGYNAFGIEAAARTYFGTSAAQLDTLQSATLVGMLKATTYYNPLANPENSQDRRNVVLSQMVKRGYLSQAFYEAHADDPVDAEYHSAELYASLAPYFAEHVRTTLDEWTETPGHPLHGRNIYQDGLRVYTTLDARLQGMARAAVDSQMTKLQKVVNFEWSQETGSLYSTQLEDYVERARKGGYTPFQDFWTERDGVVNDFIRATDRYAALRRQDVGAEAAINQLRQNQAFMDSLRAIETRLETGLVSIDPRNGHVKAWVGGRNFRKDKYDKVSIARRQPGSTFKPFVYTTAIDNGWSPYDTLLDSTFSWKDRGADTTWTPRNFGGSSGQMLTLSQGLARSINTITSRLILQVGPANVAQYAQRMGIKSDLPKVPSLALGTANVRLLEMAAAYSTLANGGLYYEPTAITRVEDRYGNVLWQAQTTPREALSEQTAYTVVDMMRGVIDYGTGIRIRTQWGLGEYDFAGKTGTTQRSADGWFMLMHPELVSGSWVGFNDPRLTFRTSFWGQGAHNALFVVGDYYQQMAASEKAKLREDATFPMPDQFRTASDSTTARPMPTRQNRVGW